MNGGTCLCAHGGPARCPLDHHRRLADGKPHAVSLIVVGVTTRLYIDGEEV